MAAGSGSTSTNIPVSPLGAAIKTNITTNINLLGETIKCTPATYSQNDLTNLGVVVAQIINESILFESKKLYHKALLAKNALDMINCTGADLYYLYNQLVDRLKQFVTYYNTIKGNQETQASIDTNILLNRDYFNS